MTFGELQNLKGDVISPASYIEQKKAKTDLCVSLFSNNTSFYSLYNPLQDAENFASQHEFSNAGFFIIGGMGNAYHIKSLMSKYPESFILVLEDTLNSYKTLLQQNDFSFLGNTINIRFATIDTLKECIITLYKPALHGNILFKSIRSWFSFHQMQIDGIHETVTNALKIVSSDYSVQCHFGKVWMRNILRNISFFEQSPSSFCLFCGCTFPVNKTAAVIAAGPSLDESIHELKEHRDEYFIIATDTALEILTAYSIAADAFVTIDGQNISSRLFTNLSSDIQKPSLAVIDVSAHPNALSYADANNIPIVLCSTGHPLSAYFMNYYDAILPLKSGSGTVTITAADFAVQCGFTSIVFYGADFSCPNAKPYAKGTYLDSSYSSGSCRTNSLEQQFTSLLFRTDVLKNGLTYSNTVLSSYKESLLELVNNCSHQVSWYTSVIGNLPFPLHTSSKPSVDYSIIIQRIKSIHTGHLNTYTQSAVTDDSQEFFVTLLPYYSWFLNFHKLSVSKSSLFLFKTLVKKQFDNYTVLHES